MKKQTTLITIGIDPGIATTGYGIIETKGNTHRAIDYGAILTPAHTPLPDRIHALYTELNAIIEKYQPQTMGIEELFFNKNVSTALIVGQARGVILLAGKNNNLPIANHTPSQVKMAVCGYGSADKKQVQKMVKSLLKLPEIPKPDDTADALAVAICHAHSNKLNSLL